LPTYNELTAEQQQKAIKTLRGERAGQKRRTGERQIAGLLPTGGSISRTRTKPITDQQAVERFKADPEFLSRYTGEIRKPGTLPQALEQATPDERETMYKTYQDSVQPGDPGLTKAEFLSILEENPADIPFYLGKPTPEELRAKNTKASYEQGKKLGYWR